MSDLIKKVKIKKQDGTYTDYIPIGAEAKNVDCSDGESVEYKLNKKPYYYNSVADMKVDTNLKVGDMAVTLGYYEPSDGGGAEYRIVKTSEKYIEELENSLKAELIVKNNIINLKQMGLKSNDINFDNSVILNYVCNNSNYTNYQYFIPDGIFYLLNSVIINRRCDGFILKGNGHRSDQKLNTGTQLIYTGEDFAFILNERLWRSNIENFDLICPNGSGIHTIKNLCGTSINELQLQVKYTGIKCEASGYSYWNNINIVDHSNSTENFIGFDFSSDKVIEYLYLNNTTVGSYKGTYDNTYSYGIKSNHLNHFYMENCDFVGLSYGLYLDATANSKYLQLTTTNFTCHISDLYFNSKQTSISGVYITECSFSVRSNNAHVLEIHRENSHYLRGLVYSNNHIADLDEGVTTDYLIAIDLNSLQSSSCIIDNNGYNSNSSVPFINLPNLYRASIPLSHSFIKPRVIGLEGNGTSTTFTKVLTNISPFNGIQPGVVVTDSKGLLSTYTVSNTKDGDLSITMNFKEAWTGRTYISIHVLSDCIHEMITIS